MEIETTPSRTTRVRLQWFREARFGMFIHWGIYSLLGRGEWVRFQEAILQDEYKRLAQQFNPRAFDADAWAQLARDAGTRYMVLTGNACFRAS